MAIFCTGGGKYLDIFCCLGGESRGRLGGDERTRGENKTGSSLVNDLLLASQEQRELLYSLTASLPRLTRSLSYPLRLFRGRASLLRGA